MKIDRQNIPEEYQCVNCSPREVDYQAARTLQLQKRKEQSQLPNIYALPSVYEGAPGRPNSNKQVEKKSTLAKPKKSGVSKKSLDISSQNKRNKRNELGKRTNLKRKESKRSAKKKQKSNDGVNAADKMTSALRNWIDNYEVAMTNHYSPELRARLTALGKQQPNVTIESAEFSRGLLNDLVPSCTTVPHAGAKILISTRDIEPYATVIEIRGKYMLANQHKAANNIIGKKPASGPFLFFYSVAKSGPEICVDTRTYGNEARFVRRSCRPNAEILHNIEKNVIHLYIVSKIKIMASTEITIAHDQNIDPMTKTHSMSHTSTLCACGLRECKFATSLTASSSLGLSNQTSVPLLPPTVKRKNGIHSSLGNEREKRKYKKRSKEGIAKQKFSRDGRARGRSTSSSCESNTSLMSPPLQNTETEYHRMLPPSIQLAAVQTITQTPDQNQLNPIQSIVNDAQLIYEPPTFTKQLDFVPLVKQSPSDVVLNHNQPFLDLPIVDHPPSDSQTASASASAQVQSVSCSESTNISSHSENSEPRSSTPMQSTQHYGQQVYETHSISDSTPVMQAVPTATLPSPEATKKSPLSTPQKQNKRAIKIQRSHTHDIPNVFSDDNEQTPIEPLTPVSIKDQKSAEKDSPTENRKLTREERKMEAIVRAFEKMEKNLQRKQEQKAQKTTLKKTRSQNALKKQNLSINVQKRKVLCQRRKKRKSKSSSLNRRSEDARLHSESDAVTSEEATNTANTSRNYSLSLTKTNLYHSHPQEPNLMSYSDLKQEPDRNLSGIPPLISPACKLIEAAFNSFDSSVENEFKFPKTKTKKDLMNEWLNQTHDHSVIKTEYEASYVSETKPCLKYESDIKMVAKTVEEFICQNRIQIENEEPLSLVKHELDIKKPFTTPPHASSPQNESGGNFAGSESAVKKRWLRQAISEETNDESTLQPAEFTTPLKKRRVYIERVDDEASSSIATENVVSSGNEQKQNEDKAQIFKEESEENEILADVLTIQNIEKSKMEEDTTVTSTVAENDPLIYDNIDDVTTTKRPDTQESFSEESKEIPVNEKNIDSVEEFADEDNKSSNSEEMAEYQKVIASFHNENIMILQTRNKKLKLNPENAKIDVDSSTQSCSASLSMNFESVGLKKFKNCSNSSVADDSIKKITRPKSHSPESTSYLSNDSLNAASNSCSMPIPVLATPVESRLVQETIPFGGSRYLNNINRAPSELPSILATVPPVILKDEPPSLSTAPTATLGSKTGFNSYGYRPMMTNLTMNEYPDTTGNLAPIVPVGSYLTTFTKATLITDPKAPIGSTLTGQFATVGTTGYPSAFAPTAQLLNTDKLGSSVPVTPPNYLSTKSYSSLNDNLTSTCYSTKIFTKTQNSDPRVNQSLHSLEESNTNLKPAPKKKVRSFIYVSRY